MKGKIRCGYCGNTISSDCGTLRNGNTLHYYKCRGKKRHITDCPNKTIRKELLEEIIISKIVEELQKPKHLNLIVENVLQLQDNCIENNTKLKYLEKERKQKQSQLNNIVKAIEYGVVSKTTLSRIKELETQIEELDKEILIEHNTQSFRISREEVEKFYTEALKREPMLLINYLIKEIKLYNDKLEILLNNPIKKSPNNDLDSSFLFKTKLFREIEIYV